MLACRFEIWQNLLGWNSSFSRCVIFEIIVWAYFHETNSSKKIFKTLWWIWKQIWRRNFALISKFFFDFNPAGESQIAAKKNLKNMKMQLMIFCSTLEVRRRKILTLKVQKDDFCCIVEKSNIFWLKRNLFCWKMKENLKMKLIHCMINLIMLDTLQAFFYS